MPSFSRNLEDSIHRAVDYANKRKHEYATLEHLLLALLDDTDAAAVAPNEAVVAPTTKPDPVISTAVPPAVGPDAGSMPVTMGGAL